MLDRLAHRQREESKTGGKTRAQMVIVFFSQSGYRYARLKGEPALCLCSPPDIIWLWQIFFAYLRPHTTIVVRHELWPAFLTVARHKSRLYLIDATFSPRIAFWQKFLLHFFHRIFVVSALDRAALEATGYPVAHVTVSGDSKYDRVRQRVEASTNVDPAFLLLSAPARRKRLIIGSAWHREIKVVLDAYDQLGTERVRWQLLIAPHEPDTEMLGWITDLCLAQNLSRCRYTQLEHQPDAYDVVIIDTLGCLTELYGVADLAVVGGGMEKKVHNVLEPAFHGVPVATGKNFTTSHEAKLLVAARLLTVIDANNILSWWQRENHPRAKLRSFVQNLCGATETICSILESTPISLREKEK